MIPTPLSAGQDEPGSSQDHRLSSPHRPLRGKASRYGTSCTECRRRKQKCDGLLPTCSRCQISKQQCIWDNNLRTAGPMNGLLAQTYQFMFSLISADGPADVSAMKSVLRQYMQDHPLPGAIIPRAPVTSEEASEAGGDTGRDSSSDPVDELLMHMSIAENGRDGHFGMTSLFWQKPPEAVVHRLRRDIEKRGTGEGALRNTAAESDEGLDVAGDDLDVLTNNASMMSSWETFAYRKLKLDSGQEYADEVFHLLKTFFCWQYGPHCVVYRPVFMRDLALNGVHCSDFLLNAICSQAARYSSDLTLVAKHPRYLSQAKILLSQELDKPSSVATIEGLLLLGQGECASGRPSQGWMYTGMAFRAMRDMGIHLDCNRLPIFGFGTLTAEDREIRRRLFWSAYTWDKIISLALGRTPTWNAHARVSPGPIVDESEDDEIWVPYFGDSPSSNFAQTRPVQKSYHTLTFRALIKLCDIIQSVIMRLYIGRPRHDGTGRFIEATKAELETWFRDLPDVIKIDVRCMPAWSPPPHIVSLNTLYRATWILLYRIFVPDTLAVPAGVSSIVIETASRTCSSKAEEIHLILNSHITTFHHRGMNYIMTWSLYSAAIIDAIDFHSSDPMSSATAGPRLSAALHMLEQSRLEIPGTKRISRRRSVH